MNKENYILTLPPAEQKALAVCGIYKEEQLLNVSIETLIAEMEQAAEYFPEEIRVLTRDRLFEIYRSARAQQPDEEPETTLQESDESPHFTRALPPLVHRHGGKHHKQGRPKCDVIDITKAAAAEDEPSTVRKSNAICNTRPGRTLFSAFIYIVLSISSILLLIAAFRFFMELEEPITLFMVGLIFAPSLLLYICYTRKTRCPVCNMGIFSLHNYPRNKHAHHLPLLGYTLATSLHIIFFFWFRCPACGTAQKIFKRRHRK